MESFSTTNLAQMHTITNLDLSSSSVNSSASFKDDTMVQCPTCDTKLHHYEVAKHCEQEMKRLKELQAHALTESNTQAENENNTAESTSEGRKPWSVFQRVQRNRQSRMKQRNRKRPWISEYPCPLCNLQFPQDEIQQHAEDCLRRKKRAANERRNSDEHSSNDDEDVGGGEEYEEYEWAGQKRIRVSTLIQGGYAAIGIGSSSHRLNGHQDDEDEDLNVDEDDTQIYGPAQYDESDVIPSHILNEDESDVTSYMRRLITGSSNSQLIPSLENTNDNVCSPQYNVAGSESAVTSANDLEANIEMPAHCKQIIDSLKVKLRQYEKQHVQGKYKCLICLDDYRNPAISVACWHVHCEQCWLRSLGARKLCPQCNLITTPKDLRRIFM